MRRVHPFRRGDRECRSRARNSILVCFTGCSLRREHYRSGGDDSIGASTNGTLNPEDAYTTDGDIEFKEWQLTPIGNRRALQRLGRFRPPGATRWKRCGWTRLFSFIFRFPSLLVSWGKTGTHNCPIRTRDLRRETREYGSRAVPFAGKRRGNRPRCSIRLIRVRISRPFRRDPAVVVEFPPYVLVTLDGSSTTVLSVHPAQRRSECKRDFYGL